MCGVVFGEVMVAREIFLRTHIDIIMVGGVEHGVDGRSRCDTYWSGRQSFYPVCVVGRFNCQMFAGNAAEAEISARELYGRVALYVVSSGGSPRDFALLRRSSVQNLLR